MLLFHSLFCLSSVCLSLSSTYFPGTSLSTSLPNCLFHSLCMICFVFISFAFQLFLSAYLSHLITFFILCLVYLPQSSSRSFFRLSDSHVTTKLSLSMLGQTFFIFFRCLSSKLPFFECKLSFFLRLQHFTSFLLETCFFKKSLKATFSKETFDCK